MEIEKVWTYEKTLSERASERYLSGDAIKWKTKGIFAYDAGTQFDLLVKQMAEQEGVTEHLKEKNQMLWVQRMNNVRERAEEVVRAEILYG